MNRVVAQSAEDDIVVRGQVLSKEEAAAQAKAYVQSIGIVTTAKPAARWLDDRSFFQ